MTEISENAARRIGQAVTDVERMRSGTSGSGTNLLRTNYGSYLVLTPSGGIPARSGTTLGSASCTIQVIDKDNDQISDGETVDVLNLSEVAIGGDAYIKATRTKTGDYIAEVGGVAKNGVVRGTAEFDFDDTTATVDVEVTFSRLTDVTIGQVVTATNYIGYSGDQNGECYVYYHGDGTGEEDGTFDLMGARCPAV
jgi:hypothetical protein